jgi:hypothetical protein
MGRMFSGLSWSGWSCLGTLPPRRFASGDGEGPEPFNDGTLMKVTGSAMFKMGRFAVGPACIGRIL